MSWNGVKRQTNNAEIEAWCEEMEIENYTINSKGEIDVKGGVDLANKDFEELPYKFGKVNGHFDMAVCKNLISLKNCPDYVRKDFSCNSCQNLDSLEGCPEKVEGNFYCRDCKRQFTKEEVKSLCIVRDRIHN